LLTSFPDYTLKAGGFVLIVDKLGAFQLRNPSVPAAVIAGEWSGRMSPGDKVTFTYYGNVIQSLTMHDWYVGPGNLMF
jgi:hypothetical protein